MVSQFGATALYVCNVGHQLQGSAQLGCSERGRWVDADRRPAAEPVCVPVTCGTPPNLENGQVKSVKTNENELDQGYLL